MIHDSIIRVRIMWQSTIDGNCDVVRVHRTLLRGTLFYISDRKTFTLWWRDCLLLFFDFWLLLKLVQLINTFSQSIIWCILQAQGHSQMNPWSTGSHFLVWLNHVSYMMTMTISMMTSDNTCKVNQNDCKGDCNYNFCCAASMRFLMYFGHLSWQACICGTVNMVRLFDGHSWISVDVWSLCLCPRFIAWLNWSVIRWARSSSFSTLLEAARLYSHRFFTESVLSWRLLLHTNTGDSKLPRLY